MQLPAKVFEITGNKIRSLVIAEDGFRFSSGRYATLEQFEEAWGKKLSLATKVFIKYADLTSVSKEKPSTEVRMHYKGMGWLPAECVFSFEYPHDFIILSEFLNKQLYWRSEEETLPAFKSALPYIIGFVFSLALTIACHYLALGVNTPEGLAEADKEASDGKAQLFNHFLAFIGDRGVWAIGGLVCAYIAYKVFRRYSSPPDRVRFLPHQQR